MVNIPILYMKKLRFADLNDSSSKQKNDDETWIFFKCSLIHFMIIILWGFHFIDFLILSFFTCLMEIITSFRSLLQSHHLNDRSEHILSHS